MSTAESGSSSTRVAPVTTHRRRALAVLAERQFGVVSRRDLLGLGFSSGAIGGLVHDGTLHRKAHAVYAVGHPHLTREGWWSVAARVGGDGTFLSHRAGCAVRGLLRARDVTDVIVTTQRGRGIRHVRSHRCELDPEDRDEVHGLPTTSLARALLDVAGTEPFCLVEALEQAVILEVYDRGAVARVLDRYRGHRGAARLRTAVAQLPDDAALFRSRAERQARDLLVAAGLAVPVVNAWHVVGASGGFELDLFWPGLGPPRNVEIDGPRHDLPWQMAKDARRDAALRRAGVLVQRHRVEVLDQAPAEFVAAVATFLR